jgi:hypothetical protein
LRNNWHTNDAELLVWELELPVRPRDPAFRRWERAVLDSGEVHAVYRVQAATGRAGLLDYRRDRDGYLGDVLDAHPELLAPPDHPDELIFAADLRAATRLAYVDTHDQIREAEASYLSSLPELKVHSWIREGKPPLEFMAGAESDHVWITLSSFSTVWLPWEPNTGINADLLKGALLDNRPLAERHTPRLNAFLADIGRAAREAGGWLRLDRTATYPEYLSFLHDQGVRLDHPGP